MSKSKLLADGTRKCFVCQKIFKPQKYFGRCYSYCKQCQSDKRKKQWRLNKSKVTELNRKSFLKTKYGMTPEQYEKLLLKQSGGCAICKTKNGKRIIKNRLAVDHCHKTGKVRGLLCQPCNTALGMFKDDKKILKTAIKYLGGK